MTTTDAVQLGIVALAITVQITSLILAWPLCRLAPPRFWLWFLLLNVAILGRRVLTLTELKGWHGESYQDVEVLFSGCVSAFMLLSVVNLRRHLSREKATLKKLASAAIELGHAAKAEDSGAYKLAVSLADQRENERANAQ